ncbi:PREDICTED: peptidyl-prolyl cis-trans isomerase FKBP13, chloroplastic-like [Ipomoea nil]|uniref:peptidyl-prolyl cis-trans isomerase FKBP13, chloroplastic-like n=1 Tax=Ipomoea nil TaxID=35883 RepID=UPI000901B3E6|nr:PREDICTED: peptidyl-prolyl cis-trans isomerase FKBP13, chloroplastic-like [Ipomoea nil]
MYSHSLPSSFFNSTKHCTLITNSLPTAPFSTVVSPSVHTGCSTPKICSSGSPAREEQRRPVVLGRREAIGVLGLCLGAVGLRQSAAAEETTSACEFTAAPSGLAYCDKVLGFGPQAEKGQLIKAHYTGKLENGKVFDSSYNRGKPLTFRVGVGEVIKGWDQGILGGDGIPPMLAGGKRKLKIPPELGYGMRGAGCRGGSCIIPPDSVLLFDVEFVGKA